MTVGSSRGFVGAMGNDKMFDGRKTKKKKKRHIPRMQYNVSDQSIFRARNSGTFGINGNIRLFSIIVN